VPDAPCGEFSALNGHGTISFFIKPRTSRYIKEFGIVIWVVVFTILKNMKVNGKDYPLYYGK
jgi:glutathione peroxidase-family protein